MKIPVHNNIQHLGYEFCQYDSIRMPLCPHICTYPFGSQGPLERLARSSLQLIDLAGLQTAKDCVTLAHTPIHIGSVS